jgi:hypothetical protein
MRSTICCNAAIRTAYSWERLLVRKATHGALGHIPPLSDTSTVATNNKETSMRPIRKMKLLHPSTCALLAACSGAIGAVHAQEATGAPAAATTDDNMSSSRNRRCPM